MQRINRHGIILLSLSVILVNPVLADIYKCTDVAGRITFSDRRCGENIEVLQKDPEAPIRPTSAPFPCESGITAVINNLHYPGLTDLYEAIRQTEVDVKGIRYRRAIQRNDPTEELPSQVTKISAEAFPASQVNGFNSGVVVNARVCK